MLRRLALRREAHSRSGVSAREISLLQIRRARGRSHPDSRLPHWQRLRGKTRSTRPDSWLYHALGRQRRAAPQPDPSFEGPGLSDQKLAELPNPANRKRLPTLAERASQVAILFLVGWAVRRAFSNKETINSRVVTFSLVCLSCRKLFGAPGWRAESHCVTELRD